jgi:hypothetical protein
MREFTLGTSLTVALLKVDTKHRLGVRAKRYLLWGLNRRQKSGKLFTLSLFFSLLVGNVLLDLETIKRKKKEFFFFFHFETVS